MHTTSPGSGGNRRPLGPGRRLVQDDRGVGHALEAMLIGALVLGAIGFAIASQAPPPPSQAGASEDLEQRAWDAMQTLDKMHYPDEAYANSLLSYLLAQAAGGNSSPLAESFAEFMPPGTEFEIYLHNGYDRLPLHVNKTSEGHTVGISYPVEPNWRYHYGQSDLRVYNEHTGSDVAMGHVLIPIFNANHVRDQGAFVQASASGELSYIPGFTGVDGVPDTVRQAGANTTFEETGFTTLIQGDDGHEYASASIYMHCLRPGLGVHEPCYASDLTDDARTGYAPYDLQPLQNSSTIQFVVNNTGPGAVAAGTSLSLSLPVGLQVDGDIENGLGADVAFDIDETLVIEGNAPQPETIHVELEDALEAGEEAYLNVPVNRTDDRYAYKHVHASLSGTAASTSQLLLVVEDKEHGTMTGGDKRAVFVSSPRPAGSGPTPDVGAPEDLPTGRWAVVLTTPVAETDVERVSLELTEGEGYFHDADFPEDFNPPPTGSSTSVTEGQIEVTQNEVRWTKPHHTSEAYDFVELQFEVTTDGTHIVASERFPAATPQAQFVGYQAQPHFLQENPGIWWTEHPPQDDDGDLPGYGPNTEDTGGLTNLLTFDNHLHHRNHDLQGETTTRMADFGETLFGNDGGQTNEAVLLAGIKDAVHASSITTDPQRSAPGDTASITIDSRDLALFLSQRTGVNVLDMKTHIYAPWGIMEEEPARTYEHDISASMMQSPITMMVADLRNQDGEDLIVTSTDGNIYALEGDTGTIITGKTFSLPEATDPGKDAEPTHLTRAHNPGEGQIYGVGTGSGLETWYTLNEDLEQRWVGEKPAMTATRAVNVSMDLTGDGVPDFLLATAVSDTNNPYGMTDLTLWHGKDKNDGEGVLVDGWEDGVRVEGSMDVIGQANFGPDALPGAFATSGLSLGVDPHVNRTATWEAVESVSEGDAEALLDEGVLPNVATSTAITTGMVGYYADAEYAWYYPGGMKEVYVSDKLDLGTSESGDPWQALIGAGTDGWVYAFNSSSPVRSMTGWAWEDTPELRDISFSNAFEGYWVSAEGKIWGTDDMGTNFYIAVNTDPEEFDEATGVSVRAIDSPNAEPFTGPGSIAWWSGDFGQMYRATDYLDNVEPLDELSIILNQLLTGDVFGLLSGLSLDALDLLDINFHGVYAETSSEAWFVGEGRGGTDYAGTAFIVHASDDGQVLALEEIDCENEDGESTPCGFRDITASEDHIWISGTNGVMLVGDRGLAAQGVSAEDGTIEDHDGEGVLSIDLDAEDASTIKNISVAWDAEDLDWMKEVILDGETLWDPDGQDHVDGDASTHGAGSGAVLNVDEYTNDADLRSFEGPTTMTLGPFYDEVLLLGEYVDADWYEENAPVTFTLEIEYTDASTNTIQATVNETGAVKTESAASIPWQTPGKAGFDVPSSCFGYANTSCGTHHAVEAMETDDGLQVAVAGDVMGDKLEMGPLVRLLPGESTFERITDVRINQTLLDVAFKHSEPDRWVVTGAGPLAALTINAGESWNALPPGGGGPGDDGPLYGVDYAGEIPMIVGGTEMGTQWWAGGHIEQGEVDTVDLAVGVSEPVETVTFDASNFRAEWDRMYEDTTLSVQILDGEEWVPVHEPHDGLEWANETNTYTFSSPMDEVQLRFEILADAVWNARSSMFMGSLKVDMTTASDEIETTVDLTDESIFASSNLDAIWHDPDAGFLRLEPITNPWVFRLGNYQADTWADNDDPHTGVPATVMELSPDKETAYVGTGPLQDNMNAETLDGPGDNSLYAIDIQTGQLTDEWNIPRFDEAVQDIAVGDEIIYVITSENGLLENPTIHAVHAVHGNQITQGFTVEEDLDRLNTANLNAFPEFQPFQEDLALLVTKSDTDNQGYVEAYRMVENQPLNEMISEWFDNPSVDGLFHVQYEVPRNAMFGAHIVVTEIDWETSLVEQTIMQTARIHNSFDVTPPSKEISLAPTYNLEAIVWMEDW